MGNDNNVFQAACRKCRKPLAHVRTGGMVAFFEPCGAHPHNSRVADGELTTVPHSTARHDEVLVGVMLSDLRKPRRGPYAA